MTRDVIYLPGLGDEAGLGQPQILKYWKLFGLNARFSPLIWNDGENFQPKLGRTLSLIDELSSRRNSYKPALVGVSAGATAALNAYAAAPKQISAVVLICGKINNPRSVNPKYYRENPAFEQSIYLLQKNLTKFTAADKTKMLCLYPIFNTFVPPKDSQIPGVKGKTIPVPGHIMSIFVGITLYAKYISQFIKSSEREL